MLLLQTNINPVHQTVEVVGKIGNSISEHGILVILSALMIVSFISMGYILFKMMRNTNEIILSSQKRVESQNEMIIQNNKINQELLQKIVEKETAESLLEQTKWNAEKLLRVSFDTNLIILLKGASEILSHNHIADKEFTEARIRSLVNSAHFDRVKWLNSFRYKGSRLGDLANTESWIEKKIEIVRKFIYSSEKSRDLLVRDLSLAYTDFNNQLDL